MIYHTIHSERGRMMVARQADMDSMILCAEYCRTRYDAHADRNPVSYGTERPCRRGSMPKYPAMISGSAHGMGVGGTVKHHRRYPSGAVALFYGVELYRGEYISFLWKKPLR